jgi:hypothetical protein
LERGQALQEKIDKAANDWNRTKDPKYKDLWYKLIKEYVGGSYNIQRRTIQSYTGDKTNVERHDVIQPAKFFRSMRCIKTKTNNIS